MKQAIREGTPLPPYARMYVPVGKYARIGPTIYISES